MFSPVFVDLFSIIIFHFGTPLSIAIFANNSASVVQAKFGSVFVSLQTHPENNILSEYH
jgi:hypothetical protein